MWEETVYHLNCEICGGDFYNTEAFPNPHYCSQCLEARKAGIKEVIDWVEGRFYLIPKPQPEGKYATKELPSEWQAKLKEWL